MQKEVNMIRVIGMHTDPRFILTCGFPIFDVLEKGSED